MNGKSHAIVIPLYGILPADFDAWIDSLLKSGFILVLVQNNPGHHSKMPVSFLKNFGQIGASMHLLYNDNRGGVAGGFNRGIEQAIRNGAVWVTLLDQDSRLDPASLSRLVEPWLHFEMRLLVGPMIWDGLRDECHANPSNIMMGQFHITRLLISSGTTFRAADWLHLGLLNEWLMVDFVDHSWCFRAQARGFRLLQHPDVKLIQYFGSPHPNVLCRWLGMELYSPMRHFYQLRNLRWLLLQEEIPIDLRCKEFIKMLLKPWLWLVFEDKRLQNFRAMLAALLAPLPPQSAWR